MCDLFKTHKFIYIFIQGERSDKTHKCIEAGDSYQTCFFLDFKVFSFYGTIECINATFYQRNLFILG